jgi:hypothetical protein
MFCTAFCRLVGGHEALVNPVGEHVGSVADTPITPTFASSWSFGGPSYQVDFDPLVWNPPAPTICDGHPEL